VDEYEVYVLVRPAPPTLRALRLVVADAAGCAGLDDGEADGLCAAVDELAQAMMASTRHRIVVRIVVDGRRVLVRGSARRQTTDARPSLSSYSELIVDGSTDGYQLDGTPSESWFTVSKAAGTHAGTSARTVARAVRT
jgi:hypothetical protein